jgi:hypothetical protein
MEANSSLASGSSGPGMILVRRELHGSDKAAGQHNPPEQSDAGPPP